ncbi:Transcriptional regulator family protein, putative isoform 2 [Hibiscus syriacus]|uniref:Transcriptional regulator family protein, putative isoform 2 n=1 Tax=Hibiscus syriacus TaxID=106335 RepID=A0A6A3B5R5_HIBSY|nr:Transcriptional regulator family protein, putative isoform 2 [Hibiscus syriacus]
MEEDSTSDDNMLSFPHQTSTSQYQRLVSSKSSGRGKLNIVDYGHDEDAISSEHKEGELGSNDDLMFGLEHQIANVYFQGKTSPAAVQGTPESPDDQCLEELQVSVFFMLADEDYRNPDILLHPVQYQDIDQIGSCFGKDVIDPHGYDKTDYYDEIEADMKRERERKAQESKKNQKVEFVSGGSQPGAGSTAPELGMPIAGNF